MVDEPKSRHDNEWEHKYREITEPGYGFTREEPEESTTLEITVDRVTETLLRELAEADGLTLSELVSALVQYEVRRRKLKWGISMFGVAVDRPSEE